MPYTIQPVLLGGRFLLPTGLHCPRCDHPLTYADEVLACERCDTLLEVVDRHLAPDSCPSCDGPVAWMGGALVCSPVPHPSRCSRGFVQAPPAPPRSCTRCGRQVPWSNRTSLCFPCALHAYGDLRPAAARIAADDGATDADWRESVGFSPADSLWATSGPVGGHPGYATEFYAVSVGSAVLHPGQLVCATPPWFPTGGGMGTVWLIRIGCPSGMVYEVALPAGWLGDEATAVDERRRRASPLPERIVNTRGVAAGTLERELRTARQIINALPRSPGGARPIAPADDAAGIIQAIRCVRASGHKPSQERVGRLLYPYAKNPRNSLQTRLTRLQCRSGITWDGLKRDAE